MKCKPTFNWGKETERQEIRLFNTSKKETKKAEVCAVFVTKEKGKAEGNLYFNVALK
jgi:hypothetical protein